MSFPQVIWISSTIYHFLPELLHWNLFTKKRVSALPLIKSECIRNQFVEFNKHFCAPQLDIGYLSIWENVTQEGDNLGPHRSWIPAVNMPLHVLCKPKPQTSGMLLWTPLCTKHFSHIPNRLGVDLRILVSTTQSATYLSGRSKDVMIM